MIRLVSAVLVFIAAAAPLRADSGIVARASSSEGDGGRPELAVDGDLSTRWSSSFSDPQWIEIDYGTPRDLVGVNLHWEAAFGQRYEIAVSADGTHWTPAHKVHNGDGGVDEIYFGRRSVRCLRLTGLKRGTPWGYSLWEIVPRGLEEELKLTASSGLEGTSNAVFDGNSGTVWRSGTNDAEPWIQIESERGLSAAGIDLTWVDPPQSFVLDTTVNGTSWSKVHDAGRPASARVTCPVILSGVRGLRLTCKPRAGSVCALADIRLRGWNEAAAANGLDAVHGIVGDEGYEWVTFVGPDGTFAPEPHPYQAGFRVGVGDVLYAPEMQEPRWTLREGSLPISEVEWKAGPVRVRQVTFARRVETLDRLITFARVTLENLGTEAVDGTLHMLVRPNPLAGKWNRKLDTFSAGGGVVAINGQPVLFTATPATASTNMSPGPASAANVLPFPCALKPGASQSFDFFALSGEDKPVDPAAVRALDLDAQLAAVETHWRGRIPLRLELPDARYTDAFYASLHYLLIMMKGDALYPGPYNYKSFFLHDAVEMNSALDNVGLHDVAARVTRHFNYREGGGYLDELGGSVYALYEHARMARDWKFLEGVYPRMVQGCELIRRLRRQQMGPECEGAPWQGLMPKSVSQDNFSIPAYLYVDNWWTILGLRSAALAAKRLGRAEDEAWIRAEYEDLLKATLASIGRVMEEQELDFMPGFADYWPAEMRILDAEHRILGDTQMAWAHRSPVFPGRTLEIPIPTDLFARSYRKYWDRSGKFSGYDGGWYVEYETLFWGYNVQLAIPMMYLGMEDVTLKNVEWSLRHQVCPGGWAEGYVTCEDESGLRKVCPGPIIGDVPHGWTAAYYVLLLRNMLMREEEGALRLLPCVPPSWLEPGKRIAMRDAPTYFGNITWSAGCAQEGELVVTLDAESPPPKGYVISLPRACAMREATADGVALKLAGRTALVPPEARRVVIRFDPEP